MQAKWGDWGPQTRHFSANFWTISQSILGRVLAQVKTRPQFTTLVTTLDCHFLLFVWERVWAVQLDLCASTCSVPGLPRAIPNISLAETAVPTDKFISSISKGHTDIHKHWIKPCTFIIPLVLVKSIGQDVFCLFLSKKTSSGSHLC